MTTTVTPEVLWAQRSSDSEPTKNIIYLTISVPDVPPSSLKLDLKPQSLTFNGTSNSLKRDYHVELEFYAEIEPDETKINHTAKNIELVIRKKELKEEYWPRLIKETKKTHYIKTDFDKWVDEDEQNGFPETNFGDMGGMGGMPGMGDMSSMMGGAGGDLGGLDFSNIGGMDENEAEDENDEDEEMPTLDGEDEKDDTDQTKPNKTTEPVQDAESTSKAKIQEVS